MGGIRCSAADAEMDVSWNTLSGGGCQYEVMDHFVKWAISLLNFDAILVFDQIELCQQTLFEALSEQTSLNRARRLYSVF